MEEKIHNGAIPINFIRRKIRQMVRNKVAKGFSFNWQEGFDVRDIIGPITIKNQADNYSCGGQSGAVFLEVQRRLQGLKEGEISAKSIYAPIAYVGGGTTINMLEKQIGGNGGNLEKDVPSYDIYGKPLPEYMMTEKSWLTPEISIDAMARAGYIPYDIPENIDDVANAIKTYGAVIWQIRGQNNGTWTTAYPKPPSKTNKNVIWNHFMCCIGAKLVNGQKTIIALQSMGEGYGDKGVQNFQDNYFDSGHIVDAFTFVFGKYLVPNPDNKTFWADVLRWFRKQWGLALGV